ncbi:hypothetical protein ABTN11_20305, partial [Acinetobacter baumannii]
MSWLIYWIKSRQQREYSSFFITRTSRFHPGLARPMECIMLRFHESPFAFPHRQPVQTRAF